MDRKLIARQFIMENIRDKFHCQKTLEGSHADLVIKPRNCDDHLDYWLPIQIKSANIRSKSGENGGRLHGISHFYVFNNLLGYDKMVLVMVGMFPALDGNFKFHLATFLFRTP